VHFVRNVANKLTIKHRINNIKLKHVLTLLLPIPRNLVSPPKVEDRLKDFENSVPRRGFWTSEFGSDRNRRNLVSLMHYKLAPSPNKWSYGDQIKGE